MDAFQKKYGIKVNAGARRLGRARGPPDQRGQGRPHAGRRVRRHQRPRPSIKKAGVALKWLPDAAKRWPQQFWDAEGYWVATNIYVHTPAFNTNLVPKGTEPKT